MTNIKELEDRYDRAHEAWKALPHPGTAVQLDRARASLYRARQQAAIDKMALDTVERQRAKEPDPPSTTCRRCNGRGYTDEGEDCFPCGATGKIPEHEATEA